MNQRASANNNRMSLAETVALARQQLTTQGFFLFRNGLGPAAVAALIDTPLNPDFRAKQRQNSTFGARLDVLAAVGPNAHALHPLTELIACLTGAPMAPVRALWFDKTLGANWFVPWHQDRSIAVSHRVEHDGWGPWTEKDGIPHVEPPVSVLESMITARIHLDDCSDKRGPLRVIPGSHNRGRLPREAIETELTAAIPEIISANAGDILLMKPLLLHASSTAKEPHHRRVLHIEYSSQPQPAPSLHWHSTSPH